ncbi:glycosyltransferase family 2 protein [Rhodopseudomonas palustris]|nr:glycosyltransferase family 2 protein [Rhodopseudomonas palustris]
MLDNSLPMVDTPCGRPDETSDVAVIMRTKNRPLLLHRSLSSVLLQSFERWHLYLVNDGGDQFELEDLLRMYRPVFGSRLTVMHHEVSKGMEAASNAALRACREEFVAIHDDDDTWNPEFLSSTVSFLSERKNKCFVGVTTGCKVVFERISDGAVEKVHEELWRFNQGPISYSDLIVANRFPPICLVFRRSVVKEIGLFDEALPVLGDWDFNIRLMRVGDIGFIRQTLAGYHHRTAGTNSVYSNTVVDGVQMHREQEVAVRNRLLRSVTRDLPMEGLLQAITQQVDVALAPLKQQMASFDEYQRLLSERSGSVEASLQQLVSVSLQAHSTINEISVTAVWLRKMLRPIHWSWRRMLPIRHRIALWRGRFRTLSADGSSVHSR